VTVSRVTSTSAWVSWNSDAAADAQVELGPATDYGMLSARDAELAWLHEVQVTGLEPGTTYHFRARSRDARGSLATSADATFTTAP
jgi:hypothetical protein